MEAVLVVLAIVAAGIAVTVLRDRRRSERPSRTALVDGVTMIIWEGFDTKFGIGTVIRVEHIPGPRLSLMVALNRSRLFANIELQDRVELNDPEFERIAHAWSNDLGMAHWWLRPPVRDRLMAAGGRWVFKLDQVVLEAHLPHSTDGTVMTEALAAIAALANRGAAFEGELEAARKAIAEIGVALEVVREESAGIITRVHTCTRLSAKRDAQPFELEPRLVGETRRLYEEVAPARVEADDQTLRLDLDGVVFAADTLMRAAKLATRLAEPSVTTLDEGPYR